MFLTDDATNYLTFVLSSYYFFFFFFFFKQKTAYEIVSRDWSSDVCSSDLIKSGALPQREMGSIKSGGAAAERIGKYKKRGRCRNENRAV